MEVDEEQISQSEDGRNMETDPAIELRPIPSMVDIIPRAEQKEDIE